MQRIIDGLRTKGYVQVKVYVDDEGNSHRNIIPTKHVKLVMGHVKFDVGVSRSDVGHDIVVAYPHVRIPT